MQYLNVLECNSVNGGLSASTEAFMRGATVGMSTSLAVAGVYAVSGYDLYNAPCLYNGNTLAETLPLALTVGAVTVLQTKYLLIPALKSPTA